MNFAEPIVLSHVRATRTSRVTGLPCALSDGDIIRLSALGMTTLEVAHDLRNLLQVITSAISLIDQNLGEQTSARLRPLVGDALLAVERASKLSHRILDSARHRETASELVYVDTLLTEMQAMISLAVGPAVKVVLQSGDLVPAVACNRSDLENVILNLVVNARDAMGRQGQLTLAVDREPTDGAARPNVVLRVTDTGCGMPEAVAAQAFRPFFTTKPHREGTGLGLAMVGAFAGRLGGTAEISSIAGHGTTAILRLPSSGW